MQTAILEPSLKQIDTYAKLRTAVTQTLVQGQKQIEALKVQIYWQTGQYIDEYLKQNPQEKEHGKRVLGRLSQDLNMEQSLFYRMLQFARIFPNFVPGRKMLTWTHYRALMVVSDDAVRRRLTQEAVKEAWPVLKLREEIEKVAPSSRISRETMLLPEPSRGITGTYALKTMTNVEGAEQTFVDFGFYVYADWRVHKVPLPKVPGSKKQSEPGTFGRGTSDLFVTWNAQQKKWQRDGIKENLHYYEGVVQKVVDGDTLRVLFRPFAGTAKLIYLRFKDVNAAERETPAGKKARDFLQRRLQKNSTIHFLTHGRDSHHRWIADLWHQDEYLNNLLLEKGHGLRA